MVLSARHRWPEAAGFTLHRPAGLDNYTFLHFHVETQLLTRDGVQTARPGFTATGRWYTTGCTCPRTRSRGCSS